MTVWIKGRKGQKTSNTTLKDTGSFYKSFKTDLNGYELDIFATDAKTSEIKEKYGEDIFLMTSQNQDILSDKIIRPALIKYLQSVFR